MSLVSFKLAIVVEDERADQILTQRVLERSGMFRTVRCFLNAEDTLSHLETDPKSRPDLLLLDVNLPRMSGVELAASAAARLGPAFARSIGFLLTNPLLEEERSKTKQLLAPVHYINKPLSNQDLEKVRATLLP